MYLQTRQRGVLLEQQLWKLLQLITVQPPAAGKTYDQMASLCVSVCPCVCPRTGWESGLSWSWLQLRAIVFQLLCMSNKYRTRGSGKLSFGAVNYLRAVQLQRRICSNSIPCRLSQSKRITTFLLKRGNRIHWNLHAT